MLVLALSLDLVDLSVGSVTVSAVLLLPLDLDLYVVSVSSVLPLDLSVVSVSSVLPLDLDPLDLDLDLSVGSAVSAVFEIFCRYLVLRSFRVFRLGLGISEN